MNGIAFEGLPAKIAPLLEKVVACIEPLLEGKPPGADIVDLVNYSLDNDTMREISDVIETILGVDQPYRLEQYIFPSALYKAKCEYREADGAVSKYNARVPCGAEFPPELLGNLASTRKHYETLLAEWHQSQWIAFVNDVGMAKYYTALFRIAGCLYLLY